MTMKRNTYSSVIPIGDLFRLVVRRSNFGGWCVWQQIPRPLGTSGGWRNYTYHGSFDERDKAETEAMRLAGLAPKSEG